MHPGTQSQGQGESETVGSEAGRKDKAGVEAPLRVKIELGTVHH